MSEVRGDDPLGGVPHHVSNPAFAPGMGSTRPAVPETDVTDIGEGEDAVEELEATEPEPEPEPEAEPEAEPEGEPEGEDGPHEEQTEPEEGDEASDGSGGEA